jgi:hypothetical protein
MRTSGGLAERGEDNRGVAFPRTNFLVRKEVNGHDYDNYRDYTSGDPEQTEKDGLMQSKYRGSFGPTALAVVLCR